MNKQTRAEGKGNPQRLSKHDWLKAGLKILGQKGAGGVRIDAICKALKVTKGSFYWHFRDRKDLMNSLFDFWDERETSSLIEHVEQTIEQPADRIWHVVREVTLGDYDVATEVVMRHWAQQDASIRKRLTKVDQQRLDFFTRQFHEHGLDTQQAQLRASMLYSVTLVREFMQTDENLARLEKRMRASVDFLLET